MPSGPIVDLFVRIAADTKRLANLGREMEKRMKPVREAVRKAGRSLSVGLTAPLVLTGRSAFNAAVEFDNLKRGITAVAGSSEEANRQLARLREVAKLPGLGFNQAVKGSINLQAAGFSAQEAERALGAFGNALATVGKGAADLDGVTLALTQIASKGKVSAEEINQIGERVPQVRAAMQAAFGTSVAEDIQKRGIESREFVNGLVAELQKLPRASSGIGNTLENATQSINESMVAIGNAIIPVVSDIISTVVPTIQRLAASFQALTPTIQRNAVVFGILAAAIGPVAIAVSALISPVGLVVAGVAALGAAAFVVIRNWDRIAPYFRNLFGNLSVYVAAVSEIFVQRIRLLTRAAVDIFTDALAKLAGRFADAASFFGLDELAAGLQNLGSGLEEFITEEDVAAIADRIMKLEDVSQQAFSNMKDQASETGDGIKTAFQSVADSLKTLFGDARNFGLGGTGEIAEPGSTGSGGNRLAAASGAGIQSASGRSPFEIVNESLVRTMENYRTQIALANSEVERFRINLVETFTLGDELQQIFSESIRQVTDAFGQAALLIKVDFADGVFDAGEAVRAFGDMFANIWRQMIAQIISATVRLTLFKAAFNALAPGSGFFGRGGFLGGVLSSVLGRQFGGPVRAGQPYIVGEAGQELFVPSQSGRIVPFNQLEQSPSITTGIGLPDSSRPLKISVDAIPLSVAWVDIPGDAVRLKVQLAGRTSTRRRGF